MHSCMHFAFSDKLGHAQMGPGHAKRGTGHSKSGQELPRGVPKLPKCSQTWSQSAKREPRSILRAYESYNRTVEEQSKSALRVKKAMCC